MINEEGYLAGLPQGWAWSKVGEVADYINGRAFKPSEWEHQGRPIIRIQNLTQSTETINRYSKSIEDKYIVKDGDLLISWSATLGAFIYRGEEAVLNQHIFNTRPYINKMFLFYLISAYIGNLKRQVHGTGMQHITKGKFEESAIPLPPLPEQHCIVAKIEELFTRLDAGVEALKKMKAQLKKYRQAVLKHAFEGKLTEEWRETHKHELESASLLLERIKEKRRNKANGKVKELPPLDTSDLPELPEGWVWARIGNLAETIQYGTSEKATKDSKGIPVLRMGNIYEGELIFDDLKYLPKDWPLSSNFLLRDGDVLFNRTNSAELVGKTAVYKENYPDAIFASYLIRISLFNELYNPKILSYYINSLYGRLYIASVISQQVGQANVNGTKLAMMPVPLLDQFEQQKIVEEIERYFSVADKIEKTIDQSLQQAERLRQSILKRAFEGKLVPQDPNDEPAERLLERIKAERAVKEDERKTQKRDKCIVDTMQGRLI